MGAELWLLAAKGESQKLEALLDKLGPEDIVSESTDADCWPSRCGKSRKFRLGYTFGGGSKHAEWAQAVAAEISRHIKIERYGWDSIGWSTQGNPCSDLMPFRHYLETPGSMNKIISFLTRGLRKEYREMQGQMILDAKKMVQDALGSQEK